MDKKYLKDLSEKGVKIPKTLFVFRDSYNGESLEDLVSKSELNGLNLVIKPMISANADGCHRIMREDISVKGN